MLVDEVVGSDQLWSGPRISNCRKPALERLARHSLFDRYMKAQLRLAGGRRKLGRNGFSSDRPRECVDPPEYLRDLRDLRGVPLITQAVAVTTSPTRAWRVRRTSLLDVVSSVRWTGRYGTGSKVFYMGGPIQRGPGLFIFRVDTQVASGRCGEGALRRNHFIL